MPTNAPADHAGARADTPAALPGSTDSGKPTPAPHDDSGDVPPTPESSPSPDSADTPTAGSGGQRCEGFHRELGACQRPARHSAPHRNSQEETWK